VTSLLDALWNGRERVSVCVAVAFVVVFVCVRAHAVVVITPLSTQEALRALDAHEDEPLSLRPLITVLREVRVIAR
jgi:hypothetical protein